MKNDVLFSLADVQVIRRDVQTRFSSSSREHHAELVASAICQTIRSKLPDLPDQLRARIAGVLVRRCLVKEQREIRPEDVLHACSELAAASEVTDARFVESMMNWLEEKAPGRWKEQKVKRLLSAKGEASNAFGVSGTKSFAARISPAIWLVGSVVLAGSIVIGVQLARSGPVVVHPVPESPPITLKQEAPADTGVPPIFRYQTIHTAALIDYLRSRDSLLAEEPYFSAIISQAEAFDINPLLLFAIAGQEQGFVPKTNKQASKIANNPFNVFHSWREFNTDITHSAEIAARTVARRSALRPEGHDPFVWLNMTYAEDPNWARGVRQIFEKLSSLAASSIQS